MLIRLITVISLILFMLLMISGIQIEVALYRSMVVFMVLFAVVYLTIFFLNILRDNEKREHMTVTDGGNQKNENKG